MENTLTVNALITKYLTWCVKHRAPRSTEWYAGHLNGFLKYPGIAEMDAKAIKPYVVNEWVDSHDKWGTTYSRSAIVAVQRVWNWAVEEGHLESSPLLRMKKPTAKRREIYMKPGDYEEILAMLRTGDPFKDFFMFGWFSGARPQEIRHIEKRHVELERERIVFPAEESKGKRAKRIIYLQGVTLEIITRLMAQNERQEKLFLNKRGTAWSKFAVCNRYHRISQKLGRKMFAYAARHGWATKKLIQGHDSITLATLMGHSDATMISKIYQHVGDDEAHLKRVLAD